MNVQETEINEKQLMQEFKPIKSNSIEFEEYYNNELIGLLSSIKEIGEIHSELNTLNNSQSEKINKIDNDIEHTANSIDKANADLLISSEYQKSIFWKKGFVLVAVTVAITAPVTLAVGAKIGIVAGAGTLIAGLNVW